MIRALLGDVRRHLARGYYRLRSEDHPTTVCYELDYFVRQVRASALRDLHVLAESGTRRVSDLEFEGVVARVKRGVVGAERAVKHVPLDYPDPPDHVVVACSCGKEWS